MANCQNSDHRGTLCQHKTGEGRGKGGRERGTSPLLLLLLLLLPLLHATTITNHYIPLPPLPAVVLGLPTPISSEHAAGGYTNHSLTHSLTHSRTHALTAFGHKVSVPDEHGELMPRHLLVAELANCHSTRWHWRIREELFNHILTIIAACAQDAGIVHFPDGGRTHVCLMVKPACDPAWLSIPRSSKTGCQSDGFRIHKSNCTASARTKVRQA